MVVQKNEVMEGDILIGHNLLRAPALLLENKIKLDEGYMLDFCTLVNALTLHKRLITLPAEVPDDLKETRLYKYLIKRDILHELNISYDDFNENEKFEVIDLFREEFHDERLTGLEANYVLGKVNDPDLKKRFPDRYKSDDYLEFKWQDYKNYNEYNGVNEVHKRLQRSKFIDKVIDLRPEGFEFDIFSASFSSSFGQSNKLRFYLLRTAVYWVIAGKLNLAFLPDFIRIPIIAQYHDKLRQSLRMLIAKQVDEFVRKELEAAMAIAAPIPIPIPSAVSNFLSKYSTSSLEEAFDEMRDTFMEERKTIVDWEGKLYRTNKVGYREVLKVKNELASSLSALKKTNWSEIAMSIGPGVATDFISGTLGISTATPLVEQALGHLSRWAQRSRLSYFNNGKKEASDVEDQKMLLEYAFGNSLTPRQISRFLALSKSLDSLTQPNIFS